MKWLIMKPSEMQAEFELEIQNKYIIQYYAMILIEAEGYKNIFRIVFCFLQ